MAGAITGATRALSETAKGEIRHPSTGFALDIALSSIFVLESLAHSSPN
jgi:hypothetical protein